jgi:murein DD-endopeptidase MepM/ murein hydrolase activator NlpD
VPVPAPIISAFGDWDGAGGTPREWQHYGIDIRAAIGTPVLAAADGTVVRTDSRPLAGKLIVVAHADDIATVYYHLSRIGVHPGQTVRRGETLGRTGMTGNATTPHLHFGVCRRPDGGCGTRIQAGWADPARYWVEGNLCYDAGRLYSASPTQLTYPVPCESRPGEPDGAGAG